MKKSSSAKSDRPLTSFEMVSEAGNLCRYLEDRIFKGDNEPANLEPVFARIHFLLEHLQQAEEQRIKDGKSIRSFAI